MGNKAKVPDIQNSQYIFIFYFLLVLSLCAGALFTFESYHNRFETTEMRYLALKKSNRINEAILGLLYKVEALSALVVQGDGDIEKFNKISEIIANDTSIRDILIAPNGVVSRVYPLEGNREVLDFNLFGEGLGNEEARLAKKTGQLTLGGPFKLIQGGQALVGRLPVYKYTDGSKNFWGLVSVTLNYPEVLKSVHLEDLNNSGFCSKIWRISPDTNEKQIILESGPDILVNPVNRHFNILNANWIISIAPIQTWYTKYILFLYVSGSLFISFMAAFMVHNYYHIKQMESEMEKIAMLDTITELPNRRLFLDKLDKAISEGEKEGNTFALCYLDLNDFKIVNDTYGHKTGDWVLVETSKRIQKCIGENHIAARFGGDEFTLLLKGVDNADRIYAIIENIKEEIQKNIVINDEITINISASIGTATFPYDGKTAEELLAHADKEMYLHKQKWTAAVKNGHIHLTV